MQLYPYQCVGARFLAARERAYLADDMGLGKTLQALAAADIIAFDRTPRTLVGCPASVIENWGREVGRLRFLNLDVMVVSYAKAPPEGEWDVVILDEAHYLKSPRALRTKRWLEVAEKAKYSWALSGTPAPNHPGELFTIARAFGRSPFRTHFAWLDTFTRWRKTRWGKRPYAAKNAERLRELLRPWMLKRALEDVALELPPLRVDTHLLTRDGAIEEAFDLLGFGGMSAQDVLAEMRAADRRDAVSRLRHFLGLYKAPRVGDILAGELADGAYQKLVVLAYHRDALGVLREKLGRFGLVHVDGSIQASARQAAIDRFTTEPGVRVFLGQQVAVGTGTNLQAAHEVVLVEPDWSPEVNRQYLKRIHRIGQGEPCRARLFAVQGTLDESLMSVLAEKSAMIDETIGRL